MHGILLNVICKIDAGGTHDVSELVAFAFKTVTCSDGKEDFGVCCVGTWRTFNYTSFVNGVVKREREDGNNELAERYGEARVAVG